jgi:hypothetical protein
MLKKGARNHNLQVLSNLQVLLYGFEILSSRRYAVFGFSDELYLVESSSGDNSLIEALPL